MFWGSFSAKGHGPLNNVGGVTITDKYNEGYFEDSFAF